MPYMYIIEDICTITIFKDSNGHKILTKFLENSTK